MRYTGDMRLYGTLTSPFVRRVRVLAHELALNLELVDTTTPDGQAALQRLSPLRKVPVLEVGGVGVLDSHAISTLLLSQHGPGPLRPPRRTTEIAEGNVVYAVDGALEAAIRLFYLRRDKIDATQIPYMVTERQRVDRTLAWLEGQVRGPWCTHEDGFGLAEVALVTTIEWLQFRDMAELDGYPRLLALTAEHGQRPALLATRPPI